MSDHPFGSSGPLPSSDLTPPPAGREGRLEGRVSPEPKPYDLDLARMGSEELVVLAKECGYYPAWEQLLVRHEGWKRRLVAWLASGHRLGGAEAEDAEQQAVFAMREAIASYDTGQLGLRGGCSFRTHLRRVLTARFQDFLRARRRYERGLDRSTSVEVAADEAAPGGRAAGKDDPALEAQRHEAMG